MEGERWRNRPANEARSTETKLGLFLAPRTPAWGSELARLRYMTGTELQLQTGRPENFGTNKKSEKLGDTSKEEPAKDPWSATSSCGVDPSTNLWLGKVQL